jgi:ribonuclease G
VSELGMIEMTRKRVKHNLMKALSQTCPYCEGSGMVRSVTTMTAQILRDIQSLCNRTREKRMIIQVHPDVARRLRTENKVHLDELAKEFEREFSIESVNDFHIHDLKVISARTRDPIEKGA